MCATETLFDDVFKVKYLSTQSLKKGLSTRKNENKLLKFVDNFLLSKEILTVSEYKVWKMKTLEERQKELDSEKNLEKDEKMRRRRVTENFNGKLYHYKRIIEMTKKEWLLSGDGVVKALQYDIKEKGFVAKIEYQKKKSTILVHETIFVTDDWVIDTYGKDIASKLMDCAEHQEFIEPLNQDGDVSVKHDGHFEYDSATATLFLPSSKTNKGSKIAATDTV
jgi:hypothetical protein